MIFPLLAETPAPTPDALATWLQVLFWLVGGLAGATVIYRNLKGSTPQPLEVKAHNTAATHEDVDQLHGRIKRERVEIEARLDALQAEDLRLREKLDEDIADLHDRINNVPERTIKLLRETKGLI